MNLPRISIITATLNARDTLSVLVSSLRSQRYRNFEWVVADGGSSDGTLELLAGVEGVQCHVLPGPDQGIYDAFNKALKQATGEWILFLGADDRLAGPEVLFEAAQWLATLDEAVLWAYGQVIQEGPGGEQRLGEPWAKVAHRFLAVMCVPHQATFHRRALFDRVGCFGTSFRIAGDYALLIKAVRLGHRPAFAPLLVSYMGGGGISSQPGSGVLALNEFALARAEAGMRPVRPLYWWWVYGKARVKAGLRRRLGGAMYSRLADLYRLVTGRPRYWSR